MPPSFTYKSYAWSIGTTSFRMADFHRKVEDLISLLDLFWQIPENQNLIWQPDTQAKFYDFLYVQHFLDGNIQNNPAKKAKTARQKTSGLVEIGLVEENRKLTSVGKKLLQIAKSNNFSSDNPFLLPKDSFIYFKQLLKMAKQTSYWTVRPFLVLGKALGHCDDYLHEDEFTYFLPLCVSCEITEEIFSYILRYRREEISINDVISNVVLSRYSYPDALNYFISSNATADDIQAIGMNRDGVRHDACYVPLYKALKSVYLDRRETAIPELWHAAKGIKHTAGRLWRKLLFKTRSQVNRFDQLKENDFSSINLEQDFKKCFFKYLHLHKIKATLADYKDLNRRYLQNTDTLLFVDKVIKFTPLFNSFFKTNAGQIFDEAFTPFQISIGEDIPLEEIHPELFFDETAILSAFNTSNNTAISSVSALYADLEDKRYEQFRNLINQKFPDNVLLDMLTWFESRQQDERIIKTVGSEADVPTIFEYIVGIIWYRLSNYSGKILEYMNLSLDSDLLPRTHAGGGKSDIVYKYPCTEYYPEHTLLIECTLMESATQRRGEMEPVTRHLLDYLLDVDQNAYCSFISTDLNPRVLSDFRMRRNNPSYRNDAEYVESMKIVPLHTQELKYVIQHQLQYKDLYRVFHQAVQSNISAPTVWYNECIKKEFVELVEHS